ncbi:ABC transporter permease [Bacillus infantis]|uniref:ABC transporter permease n=1 Tax=Bacillus infantis TaxID=324767 RepID=UPI003CE74D65
MKNKSFVISLLLTPLSFLLFAILPSVMDHFQDEPEPVNVIIKDELGLWNGTEGILAGLDWDIELTDAPESEILGKLETAENTVYIPLTENELDAGLFPIYKSEGVPDDVLQQAILLEQPLRAFQLSQLALNEEELAAVSQNISFEAIEAKDTAAGEDLYERLIPGITAGVVLFSVVISGMMIFQSASQEKKDKIAEIMLSSLTSGELMQGKIIGYFTLGIIQVAVWLLFVIPAASWRLDVPLIQYLAVPETLVLMLFAILGYLLFAAVFAGMGATVEDVNSASNFQGFILMLPFAPLLLIKPVLSDPEGIIAIAGSYIPFTAPGVWIMRLSVMEEWPWVELLLAAAVLLASIILLMKAAGKIFKVGILMHGKNATPQEMWKWLSKAE